MIHYLIEKKKIESILLLKLSYNDISFLDEMFANKQKYFSIHKSHKKESKQLNTIADTLFKNIIKENNKDETVIKNINSNILKEDNNLENEIHKKKLLENVVESWTENNFWKMEELKKMSEVLHILNRTTSESTSSHTSNNSNQNGRKILKANTKKKKNKNIVKENYNDINHKCHQKDELRNNRVKVKKLEKGTGIKEIPILKSCNENNNSFLTIQQPYYHSSSLNNLATNTIYQLFNSINSQLNNSNNNFTEDFYNKPYSQLNFQMNLNNTINNNRFNNDYQIQLKSPHQHIQQQLDIFNKSQQMQQIQQLQHQQQTNSMGTMNQLYNPYSFNINQSNPYYIPNNSINYTNQVNNLKYYPNNNYIDPRQPLNQRTPSSYKLFHNSGNNDKNNL